MNILTKTASGAGAGGRSGACRGAVRREGGRAERKDLPDAAVPRCGRYARILWAGI